MPQCSWNIISDNSHNVPATPAAEPLDGIKRVLWDLRIYTKTLPSINVTPGSIKASNSWWEADMNAQPQSCWPSNWCLYTLEKTLLQNPKARLTNWSVWQNMPEQPPPALCLLPEQWVMLPSPSTRQALKNMQIFNKKEHGPEYSAGRSLTFNTLCDISKTFLNHISLVYSKKIKPKPNNPPPNTSFRSYTYINTVTKRRTLP